MRPCSMPSFTKKILGALGLKAKPSRPKAKPAPQHKSLVPPSPRDALIRETLDLYRQHAPTIRGVMEAALQDMRDRPPNVNDIDSLRRALGIKHANQVVRQLMNHRERRYLVLAGLREMLEQRPKVAPPGVKKLVPITKSVIKR